MCPKQFIIVGLSWHGQSTLQSSTLLHLFWGKDLIIYKFSNNQESDINQQKSLKSAKKVLSPAFGCVQQPKAGQNKQH